MALKGVIEKDIIASNKFKILFDGFEVICTSVSSIEEELVTTELPDGTRASGGRVEATEVTVTVPAHHTGAIAFMQAWWNGCQDPIIPSAYKTVAIVGTSGSGQILRTETCFGCFITGRTSAEYALEEGGEMTVIEYTISVDRVVSL